MGATAKVRVVFDMEYTAKQAWGDDCTIGQLREQSQREAREMAGKAIAALAGCGHTMRLVLVEESQVITLVKP